MFNAKYLFTAAAVSVLALPALAAPIDLAVVYRDFLYDGTSAGTYGGFAGSGHPDFESNVGGGAGMVGTSLSGGIPVFTAANGYGSTSPALFAQWFTDTPGVNTRINGILTLSNPSGTTYTYSSNSFFPINGQGFNTGGFQTSSGQNFAFTLQMAWTGTINDDNQNFSFAGDDDLWVFANGTRFMDLGGVHGTQSASATGAQIRAAAGTALGEAVRFDLFFAERHTSGSNFTITTDISSIETAPTETPEPASLALLAAGLLGLGAARRRR